MSNREHDFTLAARRVLSEFGLPETAAITSLASSHNDVFRVEHEDGRYVLRFQPSARLSTNARALQLEWLRSIRAQTTVHAPDPIPTLRGEWVVPVAIGGDDKPLTCVLLRWVDGEPLDPPSRFMTPEALERVGQTVAMLHSHSCGFRSMLDSCAPDLDVDPLASRFSCIGTGAAQQMMTDEDHATLISAAAKISGVMAKLRHVENHHGLIHADLAPANWVFYGGEPRPIDFDEFGRGFYVIDLLTVLWSHVSWKDYPSFRNHLLKGYEGVRPLDPEVKMQLDTLQAATLFGWFNHGCRLTDTAAIAEFQKWVPSTVRQVARLCQL